MSFAHLYLLLLLLLLPLLAWLKGRRGRSPAFLYSSVQLTTGLTRARRLRSGALLAAMRWLVLAALVVALAQPHLMKSRTVVKASGIDIVAVIDLSGSMELPDFVVHGQRISRLDMAKSVLSGFIDQRPNDRIGLVAFGGRAYIASPPTLDHDFLQQNVARLHLHMIEDNTAIGDALTTALNRLRTLQSKSKIIILMTDGQNNSGRVAPLTAAAAAQALGVKVYAIGVGNDEIASQLRRSDLLPDEATLQKIAEMTGGNYYRADNAERFRQIYTEIDKLEKTETVVNKLAQFDELFPWFVSFGLALLLVEIVLGRTALRRLP